VDEELDQIAWMECFSRFCGYFVPVGPKYCCENCAKAVQGEYWLDFHSANCRDRQQVYMQRRESIKSDADAHN